MNDLSSRLEQLNTLLLTQGVGAIFRVVGALALLLLGRIVAGWVRKSFRMGMQKAQVDRTLQGFLANLSYWVVMIFVGLAVLSIFGIQTASFIALVGAAGLAVGLAFQGTLSSFAAGVMILIFRPFSVGQGVQVGGVTGSVKEIGLFTTVLDTFDGIRVVIPNSRIYGETITNFSANPTRRIDLTVGVSYEDDLAVAEATIRKVLAGDPRVQAEPAPVVAVTEMGDSSVDFVVRAWAAREDFWELRWHLVRRLKEELEAAGCSIPFPQRDVHLHTVPAAHPASAAGPTAA